METRWLQLSSFIQLIELMRSHSISHPTHTLYIAKEDTRSAQAQPLCHQDLYFPLYFLLTSPISGEAAPQFQMRTESERAWLALNARERGER